MTAAIRRVLVRASFALILIPAFWPAAPAAQQARQAGPAVAARTAPDGKKVLTLADYGPVEAHHERVDQRRRQVGDLHVLAERRRRHSVCEAARWRQAFTQSRPARRAEAGGAAAVEDSAAAGARSFPTTAAGSATSSIRQRLPAEDAAAPADAVRGAAGRPHSAAARAAAEPLPAVAPEGTGRRGISSCWTSRPATSATSRTRPAFSSQRDRGARREVERRRRRGGGDNTHRGTDLLLRRLDNGMTQNIGNVNQYDFDDAGRHLAYTVDAADKLGNGVYVNDPPPAPRARSTPPHGVRRPRVA